MHQRLVARLARAAQRFAVDGNYLPGRQLGDGTDPRHEAILQLRRIKSGDDPIESIMRGNATRELQKTLEPQALSLAIALNLIPASSSAQHCGYGDQKYLFQ